MTSSADTNLSTTEDHKSRLLQAMSQLVAYRGYADISVADVVREAGVSKRTFYEHFINKEHCCLSLFQAAANSTLHTLKKAVNPDLPWRDQLDFALTSYLGHLADGHELLRALFVDIHYMGVEGLMLRRSIIDALATFMQDTVVTPVAPGHLDRNRAVAAVGAIHELVMQHIEMGRGAELRELAPLSVEIVVSMASQHNID